MSKTYEFAPEDELPPGAYESTAFGLGLQGLMEKYAEHVVIDDDVQRLQLTNSLSGRAIDDEHPVITALIEKVPGPILPEVRLKMRDTEGKETSRFYVYDRNKGYGLHKSPREFEWTLKVLKDLEPKALLEARADAEYQKRRPKGVRRVLKLMGLADNTEE
ncbi:MAG: hypothetical protein ABIR37_03345 [Candidatus Saccharimonadales bacterium]